MKNYQKINAIQRKLPDGRPNPKFAAYAKRVLRKYWLYDRLFCVSMLSVVSACLFVLEFYFRLDSGTIHDAGWLVVVMALMVCSFLKDFWELYRGQKVRVELDEVYDSLTKHESFYFVGRNICRVETILKAYFPDPAWLPIAWLTSLLCMGIACEGYHKGKPINIPLMILFGVVIFLIAWAFDCAIKKWLEPLYQRLKSRRMQRQAK